MSDWQAGDGMGMGNLCGILIGLHEVLLPGRVLDDRQVGWKMGLPILVSGMDTMPD